MPDNDQPLPLSFPSDKLGSEIKIEITPIRQESMGFPNKHQSAMANLQEYKNELKEKLEQSDRLIQNKFPTQTRIILPEIQIDNSEITEGPKKSPAVKLNFQMNLNNLAPLKTKTPKIASYRGHQSKSDSNNQLIPEMKSQNSARSLFVSTKHSPRRNRSQNAQIFNNELLKTDQKVIDATHELILFGETKIKTQVNQPLFRGRSTFLKQLMLAPLDTKNQGQTSRNQELISPLGPKDQTQVGQSKKVDGVKNNFAILSDINISESQKGDFELQSQLAFDAVSMFQVEFNKAQHSQIHNISEIQNKINKDIQNMHVEEINRNTRFFKDYLKDSVHQNHQTFMKRGLTSKGRRNSVLQRQDSLTKNIQNESHAPLRRLQHKIDPKQQKKKQQQLIKQKVQISIKDMVMKSYKKVKKSITKEFLTSLPNSFSQTSSNEDNKEKKIERKQKRQDSMQLMGLVKEEDDDEINEANIRRINQKFQRIPIYMIYPDSMFRSIVDGISFILLTVISIYIPFIYAFNVETSNTQFDYFELFIDIWFLIEIIINFITGFYDRGVLIMNRSRIACHYIQTWFIMDILCSIPISFLQVINHDEENSASNYQVVRSTKLIRVLRFARYARLLRLLKFLKVNKQLQALEEIIVSDQISLLFQFTKISLGVFFITHWAACVIFTVGINEFQNTGESWITLYGLQDLTVYEEYVNALYWAFTTMCTVGYGDMHPTTSNERIVAIFCMIVSSGVFAYIIQDIGKMISSFNQLADEYKEKMIYIEKFLKQREVPLNLRVQIKRYLEYNYQLKKIFKIEETQLLGLLNENLKGKITVYFNGKILQNINVLNKFPIEFLSNLSFILKKATYVVNDNLIVEREQGNELFFLVNGRVSIIQRSSMTHVTDLEKDTYFGEISFFSTLLRQSTVKARDFTDCLYITREDFLQMALKVNSEQSLILYHKIRESVTQNENDLRQLQIKCYICYAVGHIAINCRQFNRLKGNLVRYYKKLYKRSFEDESEKEKKDKKPHPVSLVSRDDKQVSGNTTRNNSPFRHSQTYNIQDSSTRLIESNIKRENSLSNIVVFPFEKHDQMQLSDIDESAIEEEKFPVEEQVFNIDSNTEARDNVFKINDKDLFKQPGKKRKFSDKIKDFSQKNNTYDTESIGPVENQEIQFDTPPNLDEVSRSFQSSKDNQNRKKDIFYKNNIVIHEVLQEEDDEEDSINYRIHYDKRRNETEEESRPFLRQSTSQWYPSAPKGMNELTKRVNQNKRFGSQDQRDQYKDEARKSMKLKRKIHIMPFQDIQQKVKSPYMKNLTTKANKNPQKITAQTKRKSTLHVQSPLKISDDSPIKSLRSNEQSFKLRGISQELEDIYLPNLSELRQNLSKKSDSKKEPYISFGNVLDSSPSICLTKSYHNKSYLKSPGLVVRNTSSYNQQNSFISSISTPQNSHLFQPVHETNLKDKPRDLSLFRLSPQNTTNNNIIKYDDPPSQRLKNSSRQGHTSQQTEEQNDRNYLLVLKKQPLSAKNKFISSFSNLKDKLSDMLKLEDQMEVFSKNSKNRHKLQEEYDQLDLQIEEELKDQFH